MRIHVVYSTTTGTSGSIDRVINNDVMNGEIVLTDNGVMDGEIVLTDNGVMDGECYKY